MGHTIILDDIVFINVLIHAQIVDNFFFLAGRSPASGDKAKEPV